MNIKKTHLPVPYGTKLVGVRENPFESAGEPKTKLHDKEDGCFNESQVENIVD